MEIKKKKIPLIKKSDSYKIIIPEKVEKLIRFLCSKVWSTEWSGVLFYTPSGNFEDGSLEIHCVDIFPMDIGTTTYTEFDMSPDVISYMAENPELLDCKMGLIHSHNNMATFFSGTDIGTLEEEGADRNHFVSLIVNNAGTYTAAITRKITYTSTKAISYESFDGPVTTGNITSEGEELEYFNLNIVFEHAPIEGFEDVAARLDEIKENKAKARTKAVEITHSYPKYIAPGYSSYFDEQEKVSEPTLWDEWDWKASEKKEDKKPVSAIPATVSENDDVDKVVTDKVIDRIVNQLISGCITVVDVDADTKLKLAKSMNQRFDKVFGSGDDSMMDFLNWATDYVEYHLWYTIKDPGELDECEIATAIAEKTIAALKKLPKNKYIDEYIELFASYAAKF